MRLFAFSLALLLGSQTAVAQDTAAIVGRVLAADTKEPVTGAQVSVMLVGRPPTGPFAPLTAETDASGVYRFASLAPGRYSIAVRRVGYALPGAPPAPPPFVQASAGQAQNAPDVFLERGGVIAGRLMNPAGQPLVDGRVVAMRKVNYRGLGSRLMPTGGAQTNDLGEFRLHSLPAGEYVVQSVPRMEPGFMTASPTARETAPAATYYPGTADEAGAHSVPLGTGQTVEGIVFSEVMVRVFQITGVVVDETGTPVPEAMVILLPDFSAGGRSLGLGPRARADREGRFRIVNVANGAYVANASVPIVTQGGGGSGSVTSWSSGIVSGGASGGVSSALTVESRNGVTTSYRPDDASRVKVAVQDGHVTDLRLVVRR